MSRLLSLAGFLVASAALWLWGQAEDYWQAARHVPVALCPHVTTVIHVPTPWEAERGRTPRTEHLTPTPECAE